MNEISKTGILYLCATPIGNLEDITLRVLETLKSVDFIACEDTRQTVKLTNHYQIEKPLISYYEHNKIERGQKLIGLLLEGKNIALVSDAGTPIISDPGEDLVARCYENNIKVVSLPGACAAITALTLSGIPAGRFCFEGFLSVSKKSRKLHLNEIKDEKRTLIFYEAPHKLLNTLRDFLEILGDRNITLLREMTKKYEEVRRTTIKNAMEYYEVNAPKGEFVLVIQGKQDDSADESDFSNLSVFDHYMSYINNGIPQKDALKMVAKDRNVPKREIYDILFKKTVE